MKTSLALALALVLTSPAIWAGENPTPESISQKSLSFIGTPEARAKMNARALDGLAGVRAVLGGFGTMEGTSMVATRGRDFRIRFFFDRPDYKSEDILHVGDKTTIGVISPGIKSDLGNFLQFFPELLREGLFGGELSGGWPLANLEERGAKLKMRGNKKMDGKSLIEVQYIPHKGNSDLQIFLYFDPSNYQHVMTRYEAPDQGMGHGSQNWSTGMNSPNSVDHKMVLEERFSDYGPVGDINLPLRWKIRLVNSQGKQIDYEAVFRSIHPGVTDATFELR